MHERLVAVFQKLGVDYEIISSTTAAPTTPAGRLAELAARDPHVIVVSHSRNFGSQSAFTSGMRIATGDAVVLLDGDLQDPPELIEQFCVRWLEGYDVVYGSACSARRTFCFAGRYKLFSRVPGDVVREMPLDAGDFSLLDDKSSTR